MDSTERRRKLLKELSAVTTERARAQKASERIATPECPTCAARRAKRAALARAYRERKAKGNEP